MRTKKMWEMTWPEVREAVEKGFGIMLPVGAIEQHGYHLPLATDSLIPTELCISIAEKTDMIVAPPVIYGTNSRPQSGGGQGFIGTTSIGGITFIHQIEELIREFLRHGFKKIVLFNWHMENSNFLYEAAFRATERKFENEDIFTKYNNFMCYQCENGDLVIVPEQAEVVKTIFNLIFRWHDITEDKRAFRKPAN